MNHPYIANSNAKLVYQQKLDAAANARRLKALQGKRVKPSFFQLIFGRRSSKSAQSPNLETNPQGSGY